MRFALSNTRSLVLAGALMLAAAPAFAQQGGGGGGRGGETGGGGGSDIYHLLHNDPAKPGATPIMDKKNGWKNDVPKQKLPKLGGQTPQNIAQKDLQVCVGVDCLDKQNPPKVKLGIDPKKLASSKPGNKIKDVKLCVGVGCLDKKDPKLVVPPPKELVELKPKPPVLKPLPKPVLVKQRPQTESCRSSSPQRDWTTGEMVVFNTCAARGS
jgi:hypothetical protein